MRYCSKCLYPDTKPDLRFDNDGTCSACTSYARREAIDFAAREREFRDLCTSLYSAKSTSNYHCVVPVSGGKDSHYQILKVKEYGLNPLAVNARTDALSNLGRRNLDNIRQLGCDLIEFAVNAKVRAKLNAFSLREVGDISWAEHITIFSIPVRAAIMFDVPLIVWGENSQNEYGGPTKESQEARFLDNRWLNEYGGLLGLRVSDLVDAGVVTKDQLFLYTYPNIHERSPQGIFLGHYFPWDGAANAVLASQNGFQSADFPVEGTGYHYENLDNLQTGIHDYFKYLKYGFGRATDIANNHLRRGRLTRAEAKQIILDNDGAYPNSYLGVSLSTILAPLGISLDEFVEIANKYTNLELFEIVKGRPKPKPLFLEDLRRA